MASSDNRPAFRLPWQSGHASETEAQSATGTAVVDSPAWPSHDLARRQSRGSGAARTTEPGEATAEPATDAGADATASAATTEPETQAMTGEAVADAALAMPEEGATAESAAETPVEQRAPMTETLTRPARESSLDVPARRPTKFMLDLTRAMRQAADEARQSALAQFRGDVERHTTDAQAACEAAAAEARRRADEDITALAEWETAEIERIRRETEEGSTARHARLETEVADQVARLAEEAARVHARVDTFEAEMDAFFEHLLREEDPGRFAGLAEQLPEAPAFDPWTPETMTWTPVTVTAEAGTDASTAMADGAASPESGADARAMGTAARETAAGMTAEDAAADGSNSATATDESGSPAETATPAGLVGDPDAGMPPMLPNDFAAAEAEAADWVTVDERAAAAAAEASVATGAASKADADPSTPWPPASAPVAAATTAVRTQVAVVGLVSVASIATFKRLLARAPGVHGVQVTSGPDGEFLFTATHDSTLDVAAAVGGIQGFEVEVMESGPGIVMARAVDPEVV